MASRYDGYVLLTYEILEGKLGLVIGKDGANIKNIQVFSYDVEFKYNIKIKMVHDVYIRVLQTDPQNRAEKKYIEIFGGSTTSGAVTQIAELIGRHNLKMVSYRRACHGANLPCDDFVDILYDTAKKPEGTFN